MMLSIGCSNTGTVLLDAIFKALLPLQTHIKNTAGNKICNLCNV